MLWFRKSLILHPDCSKTVQLLEKLPWKSCQPTFCLTQDTHVSFSPFPREQKAAMHGHGLRNSSHPGYSPCHVSATSKPAFVVSFLTCTPTSWVPGPVRKTEVTYTHPWDINSLQISSSACLSFTLSVWTRPARSPKKPGTKGGGSWISPAERSCPSFSRHRGPHTKLCFVPPFQFAFPAVGTVGILNKLPGE